MAQQRAEQALCGGGIIGCPGLERFDIFAHGKFESCAAFVVWPNSLQFDTAEPIPDGC